MAIKCCGVLQKLVHPVTCREAHLAIGGGDQRGHRHGGVEKRSVPSAFGPCEKRLRELVEQAHRYATSNQMAAERQDLKQSPRHLPLRAQIIASLRGRLKDSVFCANQLSWRSFPARSPETRAAVGCHSAKSGRRVIECAACRRGKKHEIQTRMSRRRVRLRGRRNRDAGPIHCPRRGLRRLSGCRARSSVPAPR